jgi:tripartite-type tricarboxylate transporter receptor subunit TctC
MKLPRRHFLRLAAGAAALPAVSRIASADTYPSRPAHIIVGYAPGGSTDIVARLIGQWLSERLGQQFIIDNRPGASGNIGTELVVRAPPDGYTLLMALSSDAINATLYDNLNFNFIRDITPVAGIVRVPNVMEVNPSFPAKTVPEFIAYAKANPGKINQASGGIGVPSHLASELFKMMAGINMVLVPYKGAAPALTDLLGGQVQVMFDPLPRLSRTSKPASCARWQSRLRCARKRCRTSQPWANLHLATRRVLGSAYARLRTLRPTSSTSSTMRSMQVSAISS